MITSLFSDSSLCNPQISCFHPTVAYQCCRRVDPEPCFTVPVTHMNVERFVVVRVEKEFDAEIVKQYWHILSQLTIQI